MSRVLASLLPIIMSSVIRGFLPRRIRHEPSLTLLNFIDRIGEVHKLLTWARSMR